MTIRQEKNQSKYCQTTCLHKEKIKKKDKIYK